jgi:hypothetical protein
LVLNSLVIKMSDKAQEFHPQMPRLRAHQENSSSSSSHPASDEVTFSHSEHGGQANGQKALELDDLGPTYHQRERTMDPNPNPYPFHAEHGPPIDNALKYEEAEEDFQHHKNLLWSRVRHHLRDPFAEFMGTFIMILFGDGSVAQVTLSDNAALPTSSQNKGDYQSISWG